MSFGAALVQGSIVDHTCIARHSAGIRSRPPTPMHPLPGLPRKVDWYPWGEEAFAKARAEDKPIFLSVGYATCHWWVGGWVGGCKGAARPLSEN